MFTPVYVFRNTQLRTEKDSHSRAILSFSQINDFKSFENVHGDGLAQLVEHMTLDLRVVSSSPTLSIEPTLKKKKKKLHGYNLISTDIT